MPQKTCRLVDPSLNTAYVPDQSTLNPKPVRVLINHDSACMMRNSDPLKRAGGKHETRMPSNLGIQRAPFLILGNFIRNLGLQKRKKGPLGGLEYLNSLKETFQAV